MPFRMLTILISGFCLFWVSACTPYNDYVSVELGQATLYTDLPIKKLAEAKVSLRPKTSPASAPTAVMLPFRMRQNMAKGYLVAGEVSRVFWTVWLDQEVFPALEYIDNNKLQINRSDEAVALARAMGADLAVYGEISYLLSGGNVGATQLALRVQIVDARSGQLLWIIEDSGLIAKMTEQDWLFMKHVGRMPDDPLYAVTAALAADMAAPVKLWSHAGYDTKPSSWGGKDPAPSPAGEGLSDHTSVPAGSTPPAGDPEAIENTEDYLLLEQGVSR